jgi:hypothetical protein
MDGRGRGGFGLVFRGRKFGIARNVEGFGIRGLQRPTTMRMMLFVDGDLIEEEDDRLRTMMLFDGGSS